MLFLDTKALNYSIDGHARTRLLGELQERGFTPAMPQGFRTFVDRKSVV